MSDPVIPPVSPEPVAPTQPQPQFTQEQVTAIATRQKEEGREAALKEVAQQLNMSVEEAKTLIEAEKQRQDAAKTELERIQEENETLKRSNSEKDVVTAKSLRDEQVRAELIRSGLPLPEDLTEADKVLDQVTNLVTAQPGATRDEIRESVKQLKEVTFPQLYATSTAPPPKLPGTPDGRPSGEPQKPPVGKTALERGAEIAKEQMAKRGIKIPS